MRSTDHLAVAQLDIATSLSDHALSLDGLTSTTLISSKHLPSRTGVERLEGISIDNITPM